jgi:triacylglycerol lipase
MCYPVRCHCLAARTSPDSGDNRRYVTTHHVFLIPGFFGFVNFGRLVYFSHAREFLEDALAREGMSAEIHRVRLGPTSSLRVRAAQLLQFVRETAPEHAPIHLIGHSTGGLDARLFASPGVVLDGGQDIESYARRVRSIVAVATPHRGTPLAAFFSSLMGQQLLRLLSFSTILVLRRGRIPLGLMARAAGTVARVAMRRDAPPLALLAHLEAELLDKLDDQPELLASFVRDVHGDQALMPQLVPASMDLFDSTTMDRPGTRYASVVATARPPRQRARFALGTSAWSQATYTLYSWLHRQVGEGDGIVPTASQRRGHVLFEACADHLDVIGHFDDPDHRPPHTDWISTGCGFDRAQFEALWTAVARFVAAAG